MKTAITILVYVVAAIAAMAFAVFAVMKFAVNDLFETRQERAVRLRSQGWTQQRIADELKCSRTTVRRMLAAAVQ